MTAVERYAVELVHEGAAHCAQEDLNEDDAFENWEDWRAACDLGRDMARVIRERQESFLAWYRGEAGG